MPGEIWWKRMGIEEKKVPSPCFGVPKALKFDQSPQENRLGGHVFKVEILS